MKHYLYITTAAALTAGKSQLQFIDAFQSYSAATAYVKSDPGLRKILETYAALQAAESEGHKETEHPIFLIIPEKGIVVAKPGNKDLLKIQSLSKLLTPAESSNLEEAHED